MRYTPFHGLHKSIGAKLVPFTGWEMPVQYTGIVDEHLCVRNRCGLFDVSHMGELFVTGENAWAQVQRLVTTDLRRIGDGRVAYTPMCYEHGGIVDDILVYQLGKNEFILAVNASNAEKDFAWVRDNLNGVKVENRSDDYAQLALQGPAAQKTLQKLTSHDLSTMGSFCFAKPEIAGVAMIVSRTGYTGEDGFELYFEPSHAEKIWNATMDAGKEHGIQPVGLGARDTLRLEAGLMLYGNDIDENTTPLEATLKWTVSFDKEFIGKKALQEKKPGKKLAGFELSERGVPRHGNEVIIDGQKAGTVTSGTFSPCLKKPLGMCFVPPTYPLENGAGIKIHDRVYQAKLGSTRFYRRMEK
jgi:aminomethyltransferase